MGASVSLFQISLPVSVDTQCMTPAKSPMNKRSPTINGEVAKPSSVSYFHFAEPVSSSMA